MFVSDGLFGLSPGKAYEGSDKSIVEEAAAQGLLDKPVFTVWFEEKGRRRRTINIRGVGRWSGEHFLLESPAQSTGQYQSASLKQCSGELLGSVNFGELN